MGEIHSDGGIPKGIGNLITGGVFAGSGVDPSQVISDGPVTTYGPNEMVLDNWGEIASWTAKVPVVSHRSSGIGFVNFGDIGTVNIDAPIETHGLGARGFNLYDGTLKRPASRASPPMETGLLACSSRSHIKFFTP
ncbi:hypothetical protein ACJJVH_18605 (plasmid) [Rhizobium sp. SYY.PMSO]